MTVGACVKACRRTVLIITFDQVYLGQHRTLHYATEALRPDNSPAFHTQAVAAEFAHEEQNHVAFIRAFLGDGAPAMPQVSPAPPSAVCSAASPVKSSAKSLSGLR